ncbi:MAG: cell division protein FtsQ/DivIB [Solirubrobacterales bacterium]
MAEQRSAVRRTMELAALRERRRRRLTFALTGLLILSVSLLGLFWFVLRDLNVVEIRDLEIRGLETGSVEGRQVADAIELAAGEMTTLHMKQEILDEEMSRFPRVQSATITADFPNGATVIVKQREDGSVFGEDEKALLIASDGTVLGSPGDQVESLPLIGDGEPPERGRLKGIALDQAIILGAAPTELKTYIERSDRTGNGVQVTLSNGLVLLFGAPAKSSEKWRAAATVIADPELSDIGYVDLTVPMRPAVGSGQEPAESG